VKNLILLQIIETVVSQNSISLEAPRSWLGSRRVLLPFLLVVHLLLRTFWRAASSSFDWEFFGIFSSSACFGLGAPSATLNLLPNAKSV